MKHWKIILALVAIVLLSGYGGGIVGYRVAKEKARRRSNPEAWNVIAMRVLESRLRLTPAQMEKVHAVMDANVIDLTAVREETVGKTNVILDRMIAQIEKELTPEQAAELLKLRTERKPVPLEMLYVEPRKHP